MQRRIILEDNAIAEKREALIVYGTRFGATKGTAEEIATVLRNEGIDVRVVDARKEQVDDVSPYDLVVVGSGIKMDMWTGEAESFIRKFQKELATKKVALFVSAGSYAIDEFLGKPVTQIKKKYLDDKAVKYQLQPIALGIFGGLWDRKTFPRWWKPASSVFKVFDIDARIKAAGYKEIRPGIWDSRDWNAIRAWAEQLAAQLSKTQ
jgi:menaquinone-dependent protoporphyrinogen oxidase